MNPVVKPGSLDDPHRLAALREAGLLDTAPEPEFDRLTRVARHMFRTPIVLISLVDDRRQFFKSQQGLPEPVASLRETPLSHSFCKHVVTSGEPLIIADASTHEVARDHPAVRDLDVGAYLGVPLRAPGGEMIGSFCVLDHRPRNWTDVDSSVLEDFSRMVTDEIALRQEIHKREAAERHLTILVRELHHRVKNTLATVQAIIRLSLSSSRDLVSFKTAINARIASLANSHTLLSSRDWVSTSLSDILHSELDAYQQGNRIVFEGPEVEIGSDAAVNLGMIIHELATNACKYGSLSNDSGSLSVRWSAARGQDGRQQIQLTWTETGGPSTAAPEQRGFGTTLIDRLVRGPLRGEVATEYRPDGLVVTLKAQAAAPDFHEHENIGEH
jgi:two-component sensor histidine kinase